MQYQVVFGWCSGWKGCAFACSVCGRTPSSVVAGAFLLCAFWRLICRLRPIWQGQGRYNLAHSLVGAVAVLVAGVGLSVPIAITAGLIWLAHIGFDRALGYGLKYAAGFEWTHLGRIGRKHKDVP